MNIQKEFFNQIKLILGNNVLIAQSISDILNISLDSAYRRIRSEKELSISELMKLSAHFDISLDTFQQQNSLNINFKYKPIGNNIFENYILYLEYLAGIYEQLLDSKESELITTAQDIPELLSMPYNELSLFKLYVWHHGEPHTTPVMYEKFEHDLSRYKDILITYSDKITTAYKQIPSIEIWSEDTIKPILGFIEYYYETGCFSDKSSILRICNQLMDLIEEIEQWAKLGVKEYNGKLYPFEMYKSPLYMQNSYTMAKIKGSYITSIKLFPLNKLFTTNESIYKDTLRWIKNILSKSQHLSKVSERERIHFFHEMKNRITLLINKIENNN